MAEIIYILYTIAHIALLVWGIRLWQQQRSLTLLLILLPVVALIYDNVVVAAGRFIGVGATLAGFNQGRFLLHAIITPMLIAAAAALTAQAGVSWAKKWMSHAFFGVLTLGLITFGLVEYTRFVYEPVWFGGTLRYVDTAVAGPPIPAIITIIVITILAVFIWRARRWPWLFWGGLVMFIGSAVPPSLVGPVVGSGVEVILLAALLATAQNNGVR